MSVKAPGFDNASGSRNRRASRYSGTEGNRADRRHKAILDTTIAFVSPDQITDTNDNFGGFFVGEFVYAEGSTAQDATYEVATVVVGQLDMVEQTITAEAATPLIRIQSENNRVDGRFS